jgi:hypothetical protein
MSSPTETPRPRAFDSELQKASGHLPRTPGWDLATERRLDDGETLARGIGWFSIGLGAMELVAPDRMSAYLGMEEQTEIFRLYGVREIAKGVAILSRRRPIHWLWARVAGDVLDMATLATGLTDENPHRERVVAAIAAVAGVMVLDVICARQLSASAELERSHRHYSSRYHESPPDLR